jgi:predicted membrane channel-forming protein YqfA (hemolysin III family)
MLPSFSLYSLALILLNRISMKYEIRKAQPADYWLWRMDYAKIDDIDLFHVMRVRLPML